VTRRAAAGLIAALVIGSVLLRAIPASLAEVANTREPLSYNTIWTVLPAYTIAPFVVAGAFVLFLAPGLLVAVALRTHANTWPVLFIQAFLLAPVAWAGAFAGAHAVFDAPLAFWQLLVSVGAIGLVAYAASHRRRVAERAVPPISGADRRRLWIVGLFVVAAVWSLGPKLFWENFNGDGYEAFEFGRSLLWHPMPHWRLGGDLLGFHGSFVLFAYLNGWLASLFGPIEAAARLPFVFYLAFLVPALTALIEHDARDRLKPADELLILVALATYAIGTAFNVSYDPYFADVAEPTSPDTLLVICVLAAMYFFRSGRVAWFVYATLCAQLASPAGILLILPFALAYMAFDPTDRRPKVIAIAGALGAIVAWSAAYELVYVRSYLGATGTELSSRGLLTRLRYIRLSDIDKVLLLLIPSGLLPALSLLWWRAQDAVSRSITTSVIAYFLFLYVRAFAPTHNFIPLFVLPLVVFWRVFLARSLLWRQFLRPALLVATAIAGWLSVPQHITLNTAVRELGSRIDFQVGNLASDYDAALRAAPVLSRAFPPTYDLPEPAEAWGTSPFPLMYYALRSNVSADDDYRVQPEAQSAPVGWRHIATTAGVSIYARSADQLQLDRFKRLAVPYRSRLYDVPNRHMFVHLAGEDYAWDLSDWLPGWLRRRIES
jgi:hypothetical protein